MLSVENLSFSYEGDTQVLDGLSLQLKQGEIVSLLGPSGCGKSTILRIVSDLIQPDHGSVNWENEPNIAFVFQDAALMPWATVEQNVELPGRLKNNTDKAAMDAALQAVDLLDYKKRYPAMLSGGQRMRVSVARALSAVPNILLMDEPFAALDEILRFQMNDLLLNFVSERSLGVLFVTHSLFEAAYLSDRILVMSNGRIVGDVKPDLDRSLTSTQQRQSQQFIDAVGSVECLMQKGAS